MSGTLPAWGEDLQFVQGAADRHGFTQRERDSESGVMHFRARFYDPRLGRFGGKDPVLHRRAPRHFLYASNNPVMAKDPLGAQDEKLKKATEFAARLMKKPQKVTWYELTETDRLKLKPLFDQDKSIIDNVVEGFNGNYHPLSIEEEIKLYDAREKAIRASIPDANQGGIRFELRMGREQIRELFFMAIGLIPGGSAAELIIRFAEGDEMTKATLLIGGAAVIIDFFSLGLGDEILKAFRQLWNAARESRGTVRGIDIAIDNRGNLSAMMRGGDEATSASNLGRVPRPKPVNLPSWKKIKVDWDEVKSGHMVGGSRIAHGKKGDVFSESMTEGDVEKAMMEAYANAKKLDTQGVRVKVHARQLNLATRSHP
jgi:RHS repeat-associated protein